MPRKRRELPWLDTRNGVYYANWYEAPKEGQAKGRTRSLSLGTSDPAQAKAKFAAFLSEGESCYAENVATFGLTVSKCLDDYEKEHVNVKVTDKQRQIDAMRHLRTFFGNKLLRDVDIPACRGYAEARRTGAVGGGKRHAGDRARGSDSTIRRELNVLVAAISHARRWKRLDGAEPVVELPKGAAPDEALWLTKDELASTYLHADPDTQDFITLAYWTAARRASIETLRVEQVNLATGRINLRKAGTAVTGKRKPLLAIHPKCEPVLRRRVEAADGGWLFGPTVDFYRPFRRACRAAGIDGARAHPHVLRHSRATHRLQPGKSIGDVAKLLGDTIATVERVYGHHCPGYLESSLGDE